MDKFAAALPHVNIILAAMMIVFLVIDRFNSAMAFLNNDGAKMLLLILSITSIINAILLIAHQRHENAAINDHP